MADLLLRETDQAAVRAVLTLGPDHRTGLPGECLLPPLARLVECDALGVSLRDGSGAVVGEAALLRDDGAVPSGGPTARSGRAPDLLAIAVRNGADHVARLWLVRRTRRFSPRDRALLGLVAPAIERVLHEPPATAPPSCLTAQERRVLQLVATGLSNAAVGERLFVASATVGKHLENAYRKLGVTNRLAAVQALDGGHRGWV